MAEFLAVGPSLGTILLTTFVLGDVAALYALSGKPSTGTSSSTGPTQTIASWLKTRDRQARIVRALQEELAELKRLAPGQAPLKAQGAPTSDEATAFIDAVRKGMKGYEYSLTREEVFTKAEKNPQLLTIEVPIPATTEKEPFLESLIRLAVIKAVNNNIDRGLSATANAATLLRYRKEKEDTVEASNAERRAAAEAALQEGGALASEISRLVKMTLAQHIKEKTAKPVANAFWTLVRTVGPDDRKVYDNLIGVFNEFINVKDSADRFIGKVVANQLIADTMFLKAIAEYRKGLDVNPLFLTKRVGLNNTWGKAVAENKPAHDKAASVARTQDALNMSNAAKARETGARARVAAATAATTAEFEAEDEDAAARAEAIALARRRIAIESALDSELKAINALTAPPAAPPPPLLAAAAPDAAASAAPVDEVKETPRTKIRRALEDELGNVEELRRALAVVAAAATPLLPRNVAEDTEGETFQELKNTQVAALIKQLQSTGIATEEEAIRLIDSGYPVIGSDEKGMTPLMIASQRLMLPVVKAILDKLARYAKTEREADAAKRSEANKVNKDKKTALDLVNDLPVEIKTHTQHTNSLLRPGADAANLQRQLDAAEMDLSRVQAAQALKNEAAARKEGAFSFSPANVVYPKGGRARRPKSRGGRNIFTNDRSDILKLLTPITESLAVRAQRADIFAPSTTYDPAASNALRMFERAGVKDPPPVGLVLRTPPPPSPNPAARVGFLRPAAAAAPAAPAAPAAAAPAAPAAAAPPAAAPAAPLLPAPPPAAPLLPAPAAPLLPAPLLPAPAAPLLPAPAAPLLPAPAAPLLPAPAALALSAAAAAPVPEPSPIQKKTSITIDGKTFTFLNKSSDSSGRDYVVMEIGEGDKQTLYRSLSHNGFWRHCVETRGHLQKGEDYVATTLVDFRLQEFVNSILDSLPLVDHVACDTPEEGNHPEDRATLLEPFATFASTHQCGSNEDRPGYEEILTRDIAEFMATVKSMYTFGDYEAVYPNFSIDRDLNV